MPACHSSRSNGHAARSPSSTTDLDSPIVAGVETTFMVKETFTAVSPVLLITLTQPDWKSSLISKCGSYREARLSARMPRTSAPTAVPAVSRAAPISHPDS